MEPEASAVYCRNMTEHQRAIYCTAEPPFTAERFLVVDIGGGTVDIVAIQINHRDSKPHMEVLHKPCGGAWGGTKVNLEFKRFLESLISDSNFKQYIKTECKTKNATHQTELDSIIHEAFESQKTLFGDKDLSEDEEIAVDLTYTFLEQYKDKLLEALRDANNKKCASYVGGSLRLKYEKVKTFFNPVVKGIIESIQKVLNDVPEIEAIYLVGGFGGCRYIYDSINNVHFQCRSKYNLKVVVPEGPEHAVVKGAAMMGKNPEILQARCIDATYGVSASIPFEKGKHETMYRTCVINSPGKREYLCTNIFSTFVEVGDSVDLTNVYMMTYVPETRDQEEMRVQIYCSPEKDVWYTTGKRPSHIATCTTDWAIVEKIGELIIPFQEADSDLEDRAVDVFFDFSAAEIKVTGYYHNSQVQAKVVLDFLDSY